MYSEAMFLAVRVAVLPFALVLLAGCRSEDPPTLRPESVTFADRLRPGTAGTVSIFDNSDPSGCRWLRNEPGGTDEEVHRFRVDCRDARLSWSADGTRALVVLFATGTTEAWEVDLVNGALAEILPPAGESALGGYVAPDGAITFKTAIPIQPVGRTRRALNALGIGSGETCVPGKFRAYRSAERGDWRHVDDATLDCTGSVRGEWSLGTDYTWSRPGVVANSLVPPAACKPAVVLRERGEYFLVRCSPGLAQRGRLGDDVVEPPLSHGVVEFWPAPVLPEWPAVESVRPDDEW